MARWFRWDLSVAGPFVCRCLTSPAMRPFPHPAHRTGRADLPHPALGEDSHNRRSHCMWRCLQLLETKREFVRLIANLPSFVASCVRLQPRPLPSTRITRLHRYYEPLRHPIRPGRSLASCRLIRTAITAGTSRVAYGPQCLHAVANTPAGLMETCSLLRFHRLRPSPKPGRVGSCISRFEACSAFTHVTACMLAWSPLATFYTRGFSSLVASTAALIATEWSEPVLGRVYPRCGPSPFTAHPVCRQLRSHVRKVQTQLLAITRYPR